MPVKIRLIDIDGTVCEDIANENSHLYPHAKVIPGAVKKVNEWHAEGDYIVFFTAREEKDREVTEIWLYERGFKYHALLMNKPRSRGLSYYWLDNVDGSYEVFNGSWKNVKG